MAPFEARGHAQNYVLRTAAFLDLGSLNQPERNNAINDSPSSVGTLRGSYGSGKAADV